jgi:monofunctional biosynthetic peptidoglycan transglycosylase
MADEPSELSELRNCRTHPQGCAQARPVRADRVAGGTDRCRVPAVERGSGRHLQVRADPVHLDHVDGSQWRDPALDFAWRDRPTMVDAAIAGEDAKFCEHHGFDEGAMLQAFRRNQQGGRIRGGSTISQQTAKNAFLWQGGGYFRKGLEAWYTVLIEAVWGKRRIMEVYLNLAETGIGTYGVEAGAQRYYNKDASHLSRLEAARIAAAFPQPKVRAVVGATGFVRRHGNAIAARAGVVRGDYDMCVYR